jgi:hypothetical protein
LDFPGFHVIFKGPSLGFSRISRHFQGPRPWVFKDFTSFPRAPALDFQRFHVIVKGPGLGFSRISCYFQGPRPWIFKDFTLFSKAPALDFQGFHVIFKGPGLRFSGIHFIFKGPGLGFPINFPFKDCSFGPLFSILKKKVIYIITFFVEMTKCGPNEHSTKGKLNGNGASQKPGFKNSFSAPITSLYLDTISNRAADSYSFL